MAAEKKLDSSVDIHRWKNQPKLPPLYQSKLLPLYQLKLPLLRQLKLTP